MHDDDLDSGECQECEQLMEVLAGYFDGELGDDVRQSVMLHAQTCDACARMLHTMRRLVAYYHLEPTCEMPAVVRQQLWIAIRREIGSDSGGAMLT